MLVRDVTSHVLFTLIKIIKHYQIQRKYIKHVFAKLAKDLLIMLLKVIFVGGFPRMFSSISLYGWTLHSIVSVSSGTC